MATELKSKATAKTAVKNAPSKKTMNFARHVSSFNLRKMAPALVILVLAVVLFAKFGIIDQLQKKTALYAELGDIQTQQEVLNQKLAGYDELAAQYGRYSYGWMSEEEVSLVDRMEVYSLIEAKIMTPATIVNFSINDNIVTLNISGLTLNEASAIVKNLEADEKVTSAYVYSAEAENAADADMFMTVTLAKEAE